MLPHEPELRVLVVADDHLTRAGLAALLAAQPGATVVGQIAGDPGLSSALDAYRPDIVVWDMGWDPIVSLEHLADLEEAHPPVIALLPDEAHAPEAWAAGARSILLRDSDATSLVAAMMAATRAFWYSIPGYQSRCRLIGTSPSPL